MDIIDLNQVKRVSRFTTPTGTDVAVFYFHETASGHDTVGISFDFLNPKVKEALYNIDERVDIDWLEFVRDKKLNDLLINE
jgi:hypothetical protein